MSYFGINGKVSTANSSTATLGVSGVFTGTGEDVTAYSTITVFMDSDVSGTLSMQFSTDNTNWDRAKVVPLDIDLASGSVHTLEVVSQYFRIVYTNGTSGQGHFRLQTIFHNARSGFLTSSPDQIISKINDAQIVRVANETFFDISRSLYADKQSIHKFGVIDDLSTTERDVWYYGGTGVGNINYPWPTTSETLDVVSSSANDDGTPTTSTGAQKIKIEGLDDNWDEISEEVTLNGTATVTTSSSFRRVYRAYVTECGTYTGANEGNITIDNTTSTQVLAYIAAGTGQTQLSMYTVPAGYTAYLRHLHAQVTVAANKEADVRLWRRLNADDITQPYTGAKRLVHQWQGLAQPAELDFYSMPSFPEKTDIWASAIASGAGSEVDVVYDLFLVKGDNPTNPQ